MRQIKFRAWDGEHMLFFDLLDNWCAEYVKKNNCPVMQFTGLKDKNGKEIYEGDITIGYDGKRDVKWWGGGFYIGEGPLDINVASMVEVIGNIYKHPQLLK